MIVRTHLEMEMVKENKTFYPYSISCNLTCCKYSEDETICFSDLNYTDRNNCTTWEPWELAVRWTFTSLVTLMAVLGNITIIIILAKNRLFLRASINHFILNMSLADLILALAGPIPFTIRDTSMFWPLGEAWCYLDGYIQMLVMLVSLASIATISCDRMMGVARPFHKHLKAWHSIAIIIVIWVVSAVLALPWGLYRVYTVHIWKDRTQTICGETDQLYLWWMVAVVGLTWLPLAVMLVSYFTILVYFKHPAFKNFARREHPVITHLKKRVLKMMFLVMLIFLVCWLPIQLLKIFSTSFLDEFGQFKDQATQKRYNAMMTVSQYMIFVNPAINPLVYGFLHQNFRRAFRLTFPCIFTRKSSFVLTRGQGVIRYMWSVKSTGSQPSAVVPQRRNSSAASKGRSDSSKIPKAATLKRNKANSDAERKKCYASKTRSRARFKSNEGDNRWILETSKEEGVYPACSSYANESYVQDLAQKKISIVNKGALGHLITEVIEEETSSDAERERVL